MDPATPTHFRRLYDSASSPHIEAGIRSMGLARGDRVLDVGGALGEAAAAGVPDVEVVGGDAESRGGGRGFDHAFSSFGKTFFEQPVVALRKIAVRLRPGGRFTSLCWRRREDNPWITLALPIVKRHLAGLPGECATAGPISPGTRAVDGAYRASGFVDVRVTRVDSVANLGLDPAEAIDLQLALGPAAERLRLAGPAAAALVGAIRSDLQVALLRYMTGDGIVLASSTWRITAHAA